ncbi:unnamed protein product [Clavelina lepadiformis]|uniref:Uncharacterized protein n=1 Tax=Clavelina lepadiformis TaxID=159417 RepID=A0ABP0GC21_CLALP
MSNLLLIIFTQHFQKIAIDCVIRNFTVFRVLATFAANHLHKAVICSVTVAHGCSVMTIHSIKLPHQCPNCEKSFKLKAQLFRIFLFHYICIFFESSQQSMTSEIMTL